MESTEEHGGWRGCLGSIVFVKRRHGPRCVPPAFAGRPAGITVPEASFFPGTPLGLGWRLNLDMSGPFDSRFKPFLREDEEGPRTSLLSERS